MTNLFHTIRDKDNYPELARILKRDRVPGAAFDELLYADDTIILSTSQATMQQFLKAIEIVGAKLGLRLNKDKGEMLIMGHNTASVKYLDGTPVKIMSQSEYLGTVMNERGDPNVELKKNNYSLNGYVEET